MYVTHTVYLEYLTFLLVNKSWEGKNMRLTGLKEEIQKFKTKLKFKTFAQIKLHYTTKDLFLKYS